MFQKMLLLVDKHQSLSEIFKSTFFASISSYHLTVFCRGISVYLKLAPTEKFADDSSLSITASLYL